ncbi:hypothetical protein EV182_001510 [Spiromyces aspiralis]|uniref:Uncharacterized protein n=1 Tax=Spiromyces aspiralis TaxID=68401 RepID=A0ACC1HI50_9FUNG|nr:hypothetical protein EV182_001510 [Spiromyces aspiralis]
MVDENGEEFPPMPPRTPPLREADIPKIEGIWPPLPRVPPPAVLPPEPVYRVNPAIPQGPLTPPVASVSVTAAPTKTAIHESRPALAAAPQERDLRKELTAFMPAALLRKKKTRKPAEDKSIVPETRVELPEVNAAPELDAEDGGKAGAATQRIVEEGEAPADRTVVSRAAGATQTAVTAPYPQQQQQQVAQPPKVTVNAAPAVSLLGVNYSSDEESEGEPSASEGEGLSSKLLKGIVSAKASQPGVPTSSARNITAPPTLTKQTDTETGDRAAATRRDTGGKSEVDTEYEKFMDEISGLM